MTAAIVRPRRCPVCRGGVTNPGHDEGRAVQWHWENCLPNRTLHEALHCLFNHSTCLQGDDPPDEPALRAA